MAKLTTIEGGRAGRYRPKDEFDGYSRVHLHGFVVEALRALARGDDLSRRVSRELIRLMDNLFQTNTPLAVLVEETIADLHGDLIAGGDQLSERQEALLSVILSGLKFAAESMCHDDGAKGRQSRRQAEFEAAIRRFTAEHQVKPGRKPPPK